MNNHEHRTKQTYESYTFQPLMSFWLHTIQLNERYLEIKIYISSRIYETGTSWLLEDTKLKPTRLK